MEVNKSPLSSGDFDLSKLELKYILPKFILAFENLGGVNLKRRSCIVYVSSAVLHIMRVIMTYIHGVGHFHPENVIDNEFLEELNIETNDEWITERVGIKSRRTVLELNYIKETYNKDASKAVAHQNYGAEETVSHAANMALERAGLKASDIGMVIMGGCAPEYILPANASVVAAALGITAPCLDLTTACSTFASQMHFVNSMIPEMTPDYILLIQAENWTKTIDFSDRKTAVLIGDGTAATIVSKKHKAKFKVNHTVLTSDPSGWSKVYTKTGHHFHQEGPAVQKFAIKKTIATFKDLQERTDANLSEQYFISHQANLTMLKSVCEKLNIPDEKHLFNVDEFGNTGASGAPTVLSQNFESFKAGDMISLIVVGAGLTWGGMTISVDA